jgi:hypothetical protein
VAAMPLPCAGSSLRWCRWGANLGDRGQGSRRHSPRPRRHLRSPRRSLGGRAALAAETVLEGVIFIFAGEEPHFLYGGIVDRHWKLDTPSRTPQLEAVPPPPLCRCMARMRWSLMVPLPLRGVLRATVPIR